MAKQRNPGAIQSVALMVVSLGALGWVGYNLVPSNFHASAPSLPTSPRPQSAMTAGHWLGVLGMESDALAAAGVNAESAGLILEDLQAYMDENGQAFLDAIDARNAAMKLADSDTRMVRAGKAPEADVIARNANTLASATASRDAHWTAALTAASARLTDNQRAGLAAIRANPGREVPAAYRLAQRSDAQWVELREALTAERQAAERGEPAPAQTQAVLTAVRAEPATAAALANAANLGDALRQRLR